MRILFSKTGSDGNCSVIESGDGHLLIIDAGIKYRNVDKAIGYRLHKADALLITHEHSDHTSSLSGFFNIKRIYMPSELEEHNVYWSKDERTRGIYTLNMRSTFQFPGFVFMATKIPHTNHDGSKCECYGFLIGDKYTKEKMLWATDTQYIEYNFPPLEYYCIECNYFESDFNADDIEYIEKSVEMRRMQSHMSFETAVKFMKNQDLSKCKEVHLLHMSSSLSNTQKANMAKRMKQELNKEDIKIAY